MVLEGRSAVVNENYREGRLDGSVLEGVVEDDEVGLRHVLVDASAGFLGCLQKLGIAEEAAALLAGLVHGYGHDRELVLHLHRFVAEGLGAALERYLLEALALALVAS